MTKTTYRGHVIETEPSGYKTKRDALREARRCIDYVESNRQTATPAGQGVSA